MDKSTKVVLLVVAIAVVVGIALIMGLPRIHPAYRGLTPDQIFAETKTYVVHPNDHLECVLFINSDINQLTAGCIDSRVKK